MAHLPDALSKNSFLLLNSVIYTKMSNVSMHKLFPGYRRPSEKEFAVLWNDCVFTFDANFLLDFYRSTKELREILFRILDKIKPRIWLPHQAVLEFYENRLDVIGAEESSYSGIEKIVKDGIQKIETQLRSYQKHSRIKITEANKLLNKTAENITSELKAGQESHPDLLAEDPIESRIAELFFDKVGPQYSDEQLEEVYKKAEQRFSRRIPPGYMDEKNKEGHKKFGDVVLWFQLIDYAKNAQKPLIFVTADAKEDWWPRNHGKILGPRPELVQEMNSKGGVLFYAYRPEQFVTYAQKFLTLEEKSTAIENATAELKEIEQQKETQSGIAWQPITSFPYINPAYNYISSVFENYRATRIQELFNQLSSALAGSSVGTANRPVVQALLRQLQSEINPLGHQSYFGGAPLPIFFSAAADTDEPAESPTSKDPSVPKPEPDK